MVSMSSSHQEKGVGLALEHFHPYDIVWYLPYHIVPGILFTFRRGHVSTAGDLLFEVALCIVTRNGIRALHNYVWEHLV